MRLTNSQLERRALQSALQDVLFRPDNAGIAQYRTLCKTPVGSLSAGLLGMLDAVLLQWISVIPCQTVTGNYQHSWPGLNQQHFAAWWRLLHICVS